MEKTSKLGRDGAFWGLVMVAPTIIGLIVLNIYPFIDTIYMSFSKSLPFGEFEFEGIANYVEMFQNAEFWKATWNTILFCVLTVPVGIFLALLVAVLLNSKIKGRTTYRAIFFLPMVVAPAAVAMVWKWIFNSQYGIINSVFGVNVGWLTDSRLVLITCGRLGSLNHTLLSIEACEARRIPVAAILYNEYPAEDEAIQQNTLQYLRRRYPTTPILLLPQADKGEIDPQSLPDTLL